MEKINTEPGIHPPRVLATDLDGTLIPLPDTPEHAQALARIRVARRTQSFQLIFATGRHFESVLDALDSHRLPHPDWIICDVGTSIYHADGNGFAPHTPYQAALRDIVKQHDRHAIETLLTDLPNLTLQCAAHQREFKISYECAPEHTEGLVQDINQRLTQQHIPYEAAGSIDPFLHCGLIDLLPAGTSKAFALQWLASHADFHPDEVIYAGDSGNDLPALTCGFRAIVVANASKGLPETVRDRLTRNGIPQRAFYATETATAGVLQGCQHFGLIPA